MRSLIILLILMSFCNPVYSEYRIWGLLDSPTAESYSYVIPSFVKVSIVDKNSKWLKISLHVFNTVNIGWVYIP